MVDPVFVDTSEGRAVVADSLKPQVKRESKKIKEQEPVNEEMGNKNKSKDKRKTEEVLDESESSGNVSEEEKQVKVKKGKWYMYEPNWDVLLLSFKAVFLK